MHTSGILVIQNPRAVRIQDCVTSKFKISACEIDGHGKTFSIRQKTYK